MTRFFGIVLAPVLVHFKQYSSLMYTTTTQSTYWATQSPKLHSFKSLETRFCLLPPMVLSWNSWNWPLTKRSTKLDLPTADSPSSTSLNWQILFATAAPLGLVPPPRAAIDRDKRLLWTRWPELGWNYRQEPSLEETQALMVSEVRNQTPDEKNRIGRAVVEWPSLLWNIKTWKISQSTY